MFRPAMLAGQWYPADEKRCGRAIDEHGKDARPPSGAWRALISPHAGWTYSGRAAAEGFRALREAHDDIDLVVVFGAHRGASGPNTVFRAQGWETPLGVVDNAQGLADDLAVSLRLRDEPVQPLFPDNAVELQMPFVRHHFADAQMLMLGLGTSDEAIDIGTAVGRLARNAGRKAVFIGSTDLTHYGPNYDFEPVGSGPEAIDWVRNQNDRGFIDAVLAADAKRALTHGVENSSACCPGSVVAAMAAAEAFGRAKTTQLVSHYLSSDIMRNDSFVGYAAIVL